MYDFPLRHICGGVGSRRKEQSAATLPDDLCTKVMKGERKGKWGTKFSFCPMPRRIVFYPMNVECGQSNLFELHPLFCHDFFTSDFYGTVEMRPKCSSSRRKQES